MNAIPKSWFWVLATTTAQGVFVDKSSIQSIEGDPSDTDGTEHGILYDPDDGTPRVFAGEEVEGYNTDGLTEGELAYIFNDDDGDNEEEDDPEDESPEVSRQIIAALEGEFSEMGAPLTKEERKRIKKARRANKAEEARLLRKLRDLRKHNRGEIKEMRHEFHQPGNQAHRPHSAHPKQGTTMASRRADLDGEWVSWIDTIKVPAASAAGATAKGELRIDVHAVEVTDMTISTADTEAMVKELRLDKDRLLESDNGISVANFGVALNRRPELKTEVGRHGQFITITMEAGTAPAVTIVTLTGKKLVRKHHNCR